MFFLSRFIRRDSNALQKIRARFGKKNNRFHGFQLREKQPMFTPFRRQ